MKNKGVFLAMFLIIFLGAAVTAGTSQFVSDKTTGSSAYMTQGGLTEADTSAGESLPLSAAAAPFNYQETDSIAGQGLQRREGSEQAPGSERANRSAALEQFSAQAPAAAPQSDTPAAESIEEPLIMGRASELEPMTDSLDGGAADESVTEYGSGAEPPSGPSSDTEMAPVSPITAPSGSSYALVEVLTKEEYQKRLEEVDRLVENTKESSVTSNTDAYKNITDYEYRLWDTELNRIYLAVMSGMNAEESEGLKTEEREWIIRRDSEAGKAAAKYKGGTMENLEYMASMAATTRARSYELLEKYADYLPE